MHPKFHIKKWRRYRNISQAQLARKTNISQSYLSELESNEKLPSLAMLYKIAQALEICPRLLLGCELEDCEDCKIGKGENL